MNKNNIAAFGAAVLWFALISLAQAGPQYAAIDLGTLGGVNSQDLGSAAFDINNSGQIAGSAVLSDNATNHAFLYSGGTLHDLGTLPGDATSIGLGINDLGQVVGRSTPTDTSKNHAFLYSGGTMQNLGSLGGAKTTAAGINHAGQVVGSSNTILGKSHAFLYSGGTMHDLGTLGGDSSDAFAINSTGQVAGEAKTISGVNHAFLYSGGSMHDLGTLGGTQSGSFGINDAGEVVGGSQISGDTTYHAFLYSGGSMHDLGTLNGDAAVAISINNAGEIVGTLFPPGSVIGGKIAGSPIGAFLYVNGTMYNLNSLVPGSNVNFVAAFGINDSGQIAVDGVLSNGEIHGFLLNPSASGQLLSISTRLDVLAGNEVEIAGFIIKGNANKKVLVRGLGPTLSQFGVPNVLSDPILTLHHTDAQGHDTIVASNDNWKVPMANEVAVQATGKAPPNDAESALVVTVAPGNYTAVMTGHGAQTGNGLVEVYDLDGSATTTLSSISTRGFVQTGNNVMIAGVTSGGAGLTNLLVRALGPTLSQFGVPSVLANPQLALYDANGTLIYSNNDWVSSPQKPQIQTSGLAPPNNLEPAIITTRPAGNITAIVNGVNNTTGNALVEVYTLP